MTPNEARIHRWRAHWNRKWRGRYLLGVVVSVALSGASGVLALFFGAWTVLVSMGLLMIVVFGAMGRAFTRQDRREEYAIFSGREPPKAT